MSVRCAVPACSNYRTKNGDKTFLQAPKQKAVRDEWFRVLGVPDTVQEDAVICEDHFEVDDTSEGIADCDANSTSPSDSEAEAEPGPKNLKRKSITESKLPFKKKMLSQRWNSSKEVPEDAVQTNYSNSTSPSSPVSPASGSQENSESAWSVKEGPLLMDDDSNGSGKLVIKSEPEDDGYETREVNGGHDYLGPKQLLQGNIKIEASPVELCEVLSLPFLEIVDQPEKSYRFRYKRESVKPHGPLKSRSCVNKLPRNSRGPMVALRNFYGEEAVIRTWLFCGNQVSPHQLVAPPQLPGSELQYEPHEVHVTSETEFTASFDKLNILHVVCGEKEYQRRFYEKKMFCLSNQYSPPAKLPRMDFNAVKDEVKKIEKDIARLYFEAFAKTNDGYEKICDIFSEDIKNKKSPKTNDLRILRQSHEEGSCRGNQLILIFTEKLIKDVNVEFFEEDEEGEITWRCAASFKESDIHKQVAISFWTPPYKDLHIKEPVPVFFRLVRKTDGAYSHNRTYRYMPADCPCSSPNTSQVPMDVYLKWPRRRECTSPDKVLVKDACVQTGVQTGVQVISSVARTTAPECTNDEMNVIRQPRMVPVRTGKLQYVKYEPNRAPKPSLVQPKLSRSHHPNKAASPISSPAASHIRPTMTMDRKYMQFPVVRVEGQKYLRVQIPKSIMFKGIPTPPDPLSTPPPLSAIPPSQIKTETETK